MNNKYWYFRKLFWVSLFSLLFFWITFSAWPIESEAGTTDTDIWEIWAWETDEVDELIDKAWLGDYNTDGSATLYIKNLIDFFLAILWFVALLILIYWFYMLLSKDNSEETMWKAKSIIIRAFVAITIIWFSRLIVSFIFGLYLTWTT